MVAGGWIVWAGAWVRGVGAGAVHKVVNVIDGVALFDGDILVAVGDGGGCAAAQGEGVGAVLVVVGPVLNGIRLASGGVVVGVVGLVDDGVALDLGNLAVVADDPVIAGDGGGTGAYVVGVARDNGGIVGDKSERDRRNSNGIADPL